MLYDLPSEFINQALAAGFEKPAAFRVAREIAEGRNKLKQDLLYIKPFFKKYDDDTKISKLTKWPYWKVKEFREYIL